MSSSLLLIFATDTSWPWLLLRKKSPSPPLNNGSRFLKTPPIFWPLAETRFQRNIARKSWNNTTCPKSVSTSSLCSNMAIVLTLFYKSWEVFSLWLEVRYFLAFQTDNVCRSRSPSNDHLDWQFNECFWWNHKPWRFICHHYYYYCLFQFASPSLGAHSCLPWNRCLFCHVYWLSLLDYHWRTN